MFLIYEALLKDVQTLLSTWTEWLLSLWIQVESRILLWRSYGLLLMYDSRLEMFFIYYIGLVWEYHNAITAIIDIGNDE